VGQSGFLWTPIGQWLDPRSAIRGGDILITITGYIGRSCVFPVDMPESNINQHIARVRIVDRRVMPSWVSWALQDPRQRNLLERDLTGLAYPQISLSQVQAVPLPVPSDDEQEKITAALDAAEAKLQSERDAFEKLRTLKHGLMDDLLTGRVRVSVPEDAAA
jgi:type I restriction enzyme S subunit